MKKRLLALLLAGIITAAMASCTTETGREDGSQNGTEAEQTINPGDTQEPSIAGWTNVDETVYVAIRDGITLTAVEGGATVKANIGDTLRRVRVSNTGKSEVEKNGIRYYADSDKLTANDIVGATFAVCDPTVTKYGKDKDGVNIRAFATTKSASLGTLKFNESVTVVAEGLVGQDGWSKVQFNKNGTQVTGFISTSYLSDSILPDYDKIDYKEHFTNCEPVTKYVVVENSVRMRVNANLNSSVAKYLNNGDAVILLATGTVDGMNWSKIKVADKVEEGDTQTYTEGYLASSYLFDNAGGTIMTLDAMLAAYPALKKEATPLTLYVSNEADSLNVRSSPDFVGSGNIIGSAALKKQDTVKVVARGVVNEKVVALLEITQDGKTIYGFVNAKYLTSDPDGTPVISLDLLLMTYNFTAITPKTMKAKGPVNCNSKPENESDTKKLEDGQIVTVYAQGESKGVIWYIFQKEANGPYYFAGADKFVNN